ncbi:xanthine dehydrogenase small subunit [Methylorubrum populi]|uniref:Xanthine dehydrogenase iron-sulfur subunit n=1 Tax=Methylorubrum populi TaxID=223967 RepID=A0A833J1M0_9HYPH|nr:xanthine dehydrogenase small subunit [Methylorubrum populi]KAB7781952.1 Xanthine dehydrogenase iron-sulfur subunit [Methylorubrum populi]
MPAKAPIRFYHDGGIVEVANAEPTVTVLDWLREAARRKGTKEGCAEGDCGACTVLVAELMDESALPADTNAVRIGRLLVRPMNACIKFLPTLDGCALLTVEDLQRVVVRDDDGLADDLLHPVQQAMVECHGSQCGFCTPGFIMTLTATYERHCEAGTRPTRAELSDDLAGNLCRCTGYRPILEAGQLMFDLPERRIDTAPIERALLEIADASAHYDGGRARYWAPRDLDEFAARRVAEPDARLLAGATDIGLWVNKQMRELGDVLYIGNVDELKRIERVDGFLRIGSVTPLDDAFKALVSHWPTLNEVYMRFASPPVRHAGTIGGNIANGSPIGDGPPTLMALGAELVLRCGEQRRRIALDQFYHDYMKNDLMAGEFIERVDVPLPTSSHEVRVYKVSKRYDSDISAVCAGLMIARSACGTISQARFAFGGMAATVRRAPSAEAAIVGSDWSEIALRKAQQALLTEFTPLTDLRASSDYRRRVVANLLERFWLETRNGELPPLPPAQTSIYATMRQ